MSDIITLNVGGTLFTSTKETLTEIPYIKKLLETELNVVKMDGHIFIDRSPEYFRIILDYARNITHGKITIDVPLNLSSDMMKKEFQYYCINILDMIFSNSMDNMKHDIKQLNNDIKQLNDGMNNILVDTKMMIQKVRNDIAGISNNSNDDSSTLNDIKETVDHIKSTLYFDGGFGSDKNIIYETYQIINKQYP